MSEDVMVFASSTRWLRNQSRAPLNVSDVDLSTCRVTLRLAPASRWSASSASLASSESAWTAGGTSPVVVRSDAAIAGNTNRKASEAGAGCIEIANFIFILPDFPAGLQAASSRWTFDGLSADRAADRSAG